MTLQASIQLQDRMSGILNSITQSMSFMMNTFQAAQAHVNAGFNAAAMDQARQGIARASAELAQYNEQLQRSVTIPPPTVQQPAWNSIAPTNVITSTGAVRYEEEFRAANQAAQQLMQTQQAISARARSMTVTPPGMLNDVAMVENRMQSLTQRVQQLNSVPVNLRTEQTNRELESLRGQLAQASVTQRELNAAMGRMDISATNAAYRQLNTIIDTAEHNIRDNIVAQDQFNQRVAAGSAAYGGLIGKVKQFIGMYMGIQGIRMSVRFVSDTISLQNVQREAETKLDAIMRQRMGADAAAVQSIKDFTSMQQAIGVVGDEVQLFGAQQLATFLNSTDALQTLIPAMNNLAVQQNGVNVSTGDMVNIGNLMGKVMQGQVGALTRVGVTFDAAQEHVLKFGNEQERAAVLAQVITDNVSNMNAIMANTPQGQIQQMANTWGDIKEVVGARLYPAVMRFFNTINTNMPRAETVVMGLAGVLNILITGFSQVVGAAGAAVGFIQSNWAYIEPVIWGTVGAMVAYKGAIIAYNVVQGISNGIKSAAIALQYAHAAVTGTAVAQTTAETAAQMGLNTAMLACPLTWIVGGIVLVISAIYAAVAYLNHFKGTSISATGIVMGAFAVLGAFLYNSFILPSWNIFAEFANFIGNFMNDPVAAVKVLFYDLAIYVVSKVAEMAHSIENLVNAIPGVEINITSKLDNIKGKLERDVQNIKDESGWKEYVKKKEKIEYDVAAKWGYNAGKGFEGKVKDIYNGLGGNETGKLYGGGAQSTWDNIDANTGGTAANTAAMADSIDEELKYMRDAAEQEVINRFTLAELKVDVKNNNTLTKKTDFDDMGRFLSAFTAEILASAAEGGHI